MKKLFFNTRFLLLALFFANMFACTNVDPQASSAAEEIRLSKLLIVQTWLFDSLACPNIFKENKMDSVAELVQWYSFAPTSKRVFSINSNTLTGRIYPQSDHADFQAGLDSLQGKTIKEVRFVYESPYLLDTILSPVTLSNCKWWYKKAGSVIYGYKWENEMCTAVQYALGATSYVRLTYINGKWSHHSILPFANEQKANIAAILSAIALKDK